MACFRFLAVILLIGTLFPAEASAASFWSARSLVISESPEGNAYVAGTDVAVVAPLSADLVGAAGTLTVAGPVEGDILAAGGTVTIERPVQGDVRALGAQVSVTGPVSGDLVLAGGTVVASSTAAETRILGGTVRMNGGGAKTVIYGSDIQLSGIFQGDIEVLATDRLTLEEGTVISGELRYDAPQEAGIPSTATVTGGVFYTGASSYLPSVEEAQTFAIAGAGVFLVVRIISLLIGAALLAGLFPLFSQRVADRTLARSPGKFALLALLGFAVVFAAPVLIILLLVSFVGMAVAFLLLVAYLLLLALGYLYAGVIAGAALGRGLLNQEQVTWKLAILGMLVLCLVGMVPVIGKLILFLLFLAATGAIVAIAYRFAFSRTDALETETL